MGNYVKVKRHVLLSGTGYKPLSYWAKAESIELDNGNNLETEITQMKNNTNKKSDTSLMLASNTQDEVTVTATQMQSLLNLLSLTIWNGGDY
jgi:hypothetical protein